MTAYLITALLVFVIVNRELSKNPKKFTNEYVTIGLCRWISVAFALLWPGIILWWVYDCFVGDIDE